MLEMPCDFVSQRHFEFSDLFKQIVAPYHGLIDSSVLLYLAEKLEIETELHTAVNNQSQTNNNQVNESTINKQSKKRKNPFLKRSATHDLDDALSLRSQVS